MDFARSSASLRFEYASSRAASEDSRNLVASACSASFSVSTAFNRARTAGEGIKSIVVAPPTPLVDFLAPDNEKNVDLFPVLGVVVSLVDACSPAPRRSFPIVPTRASLVFDRGVTNEPSFSTFISPLVPSFSFPRIEA